MVPAQVPGHGPGEGCDFCDALRLEQADEEDLDAVIAEEEEGEGERAVDLADGDETVVVDDDDATTLHDSDDSMTLRALQEESIIKGYLASSSSTASSFNNNMDPLDHCPHPPHPRPHETHKNPSNETQSHYSSSSSSSSSLYGYRDAEGRMGARDQDEDERQKKRASDWARSYRGLVPDVETLVRFGGGEEVVGAVGVGAGGWI